MSLCIQTLWGWSPLWHSWWCILALTLDTQCILTAASVLPLLLLPAPPVRVFNSRALLPSYLCFSYKTTITHAKYQFHFKRAASTTIARTMLLNFAGNQLDITSGGFCWRCFILRILSAGDSSRDWSEKVRVRSHEPNVWQDAASPTGFLRWDCDDGRQHWQPNWR